MTQVSDPGPSCPSCEKLKVYVIGYDDSALRKNSY